MQCTALELRNICLFPSNGIQEYPINDYDEVHPGIFIGNVSSASSLDKLKALGIGFVLNAAYGTDSSLNMVQVMSDDAYAKAGIRFLGIPAIDMMSYPLDKHFTQASAFIREGMKSGRCVLVHCKQGISRSAALVLAYLVLEMGMDVKEATRTVRSRREIFPNDGFLEQLCNVDVPRKFVSKKKYGTCHKKNAFSLRELQTVVVHPEKNKLPQDMSKDFMELRHICENNYPIDGRSHFHRFDEVYPGIYIGNHESAASTRLLKHMNIGYVLNAAYGDDSAIGMVKVLPPEVYDSEGIRFLGIPAVDNVAYPIERHFAEASAFIRLGLLSGKKVLVHCMMGISRSATLVLAYLVIEEGLNIKDATRMVRTHRFIYPNHGFLHKLCNLNSR